MVKTVKTSTVERFDPLTNRWSILPNMKVARSRHASCCLKGNLYVFMGLDIGERYLNIIEKLNYEKKE